MSENISSTDIKVIPFCPQSIEEMRARLPKALENPMEYSGTNNLPDCGSEHVFDCLDGTRAIIRHFTCLGKHMIHAAIGGAPGVKIKDESVEQFIVTASRLMHDLTDRLIHRTFEIVEGAVVITYDME